MIHSTVILTALRRHLAFAGAFVFAAILGLVSPSANAAYVQVYSTIQKGALTFTGNTLELNGNNVAASGTPGTTATGGAFIAADLPGTRYGTFPFGTTGPTTQYINNSSRAVLTIPPGATVLYAELIWSGTIGTFTTAQLNTAVTFKTASGGSYTISPNIATAGSSGVYYTRSANVTGLVQIAGSGTYTVGGVPAMVATGGNVDAAGWTLAVAYADPSQVARNLTIFVGAEQAGASAASISGFCTPVAGPVNGRLLVSAVEGDASIPNDTMLFGPTSVLSTANRLFGSNNIIDNFFASQINGNNGTLDTTGTFGTFNSPPGGGLAGARQGYDITNVDVTSQLLNSQTTAFAQGTTTGDNYAINALALQINVTSPVFPVAVKLANKTSTFVGDTLRYTVSLDNTAGNGAANNVTFFDTVPAGMVFVPNSVMVNGSVQPGADPTVGFSVNNIGVGATVTVSFDVNVVSLPASPSAASFSNSARWTYTYIACAGMVAQSGAVATNLVTTSAARLEPVKTVSPSGPLVGGQTAVYTIAIPNTGMFNTSGTTLADPIPAGSVYIAGSTKLNGVSVADGPGGVMPFAAAALVRSTGQAAGVIAVNATATVQFSVAATSSGAVNNLATIDPDGAGPGTAITVSVVNSALSGPAVAKSFVPSTVGASAVSVLTVTLTNPNATAITNAGVTDNLPSGLVVASPANATTSCSPGTVSATPSGTTLTLAGATIPASGSCNLSVNVTAAVAGTYTNTIAAGAVSSSNAGASTAGSQSLTVTQAPALSKSFTPGTVAANAVSTLTITLTNPTTTAMTNAAVADIFPSTSAGAPGNMTLFDTVTTNTCGGALTTSTGGALAVGSDSVKLTGATIPAANVCTLTVRVKAPVGGTYGNTIAVGALTTSGGANTAQAAATLQVASPQISKKFALSAVAANTATAMTITLTNVTGSAISALSFTDTYPANLVNSSTTVTNTGCAGTATASATATNPGTLTFSGGTLAAGASCTLSVNVQSAVAGSYTNTLAAGSVGSSIGSNAVGASATLDVSLPSITKAFGAVTVALNATTTLVITLNNPTAAAMTGAAFTDTLPSGLLASAAAGTCVGTKTASGSTVSLTAGTIPAGGSCTVTATVTASSVGLKLNTIAAGGLKVTGPSSQSNATPATASLTVLSPPTVTKSFLSSPILPNTGTSALQIVLANGNPTALTGTTFTDTFAVTPGAMTIADLSTSNSCGGSLLNNLGGALAIGSAGVQLTGGTIPATGSCTIVVNVKASLAGDYVNTIAASPGAGFLSTANGGANTVAATAALTVRLAAPSVAKSFSPSTIVANSSTTLTLTISNSSTAQAITGLALTDIFPAGLKVFSVPAFTNTCGGTVTSGTAANDTSIGISNATVPFNAGATGSCSISVAVTSTVTAASPGLVNTTSTATSTNANTSATAFANLTVTPPPLTAPTIVKTFLQPSIGSGDISTIRFVLDSANVSILTNANFTDTLTNMSVASTLLGGTCVGATNSPALVVGATGTNALNLTVPNLSPGGCSVEVQVTSTKLGANPNSVSGVTTTQTVTAGAGSGPVDLTVVVKPTIAKAFSPSTIANGGSSTATFTLGNGNASALTNVNFTDTLVNISAASTVIAGTCVAATNSPALAVGATGTNALNLTVPSVPAGGCTVTVVVTSTTAGALPNTSSGVTSAQSPTAGLISNTAVLTVGAGGVQLNGFVYNDTNHNLQFDGSESGTGQVLYAKLMATGGTTALRAAAVNSVTGAYQLSGVPAGTYVIFIDDNSSLSDIAPTLPAGFLGTEMPDQRRSNVQVATSDLQNLNFGLYNGSKLSGVVFADTGFGGGAANNGVRDGGEAGLAGVTVKVTSSSGSTTFDSTTTAGDGSYTLWLPTAAVSAVLKVTQTNLASYLSTGGTAGTTAGAYDRATDTLTLTNVTGSVFTDVNFADVPANRFAANGLQSGVAGGVVFYPHRFNAGTGGAVTFTAVSATGWLYALYQDVNCNGQIDAGDTILNAAVVVLAGDQLCLIDKVSVPPGTATGVQDTVTVQASFSYTQTNPLLSAALFVTDSTTVGVGSAGLVLTKATDKTAASAGDVITYTVSYQNNSSAPITTIVVSDATPTYTSFVGASCGPLPLAISSCVLITAPAVGAVGAIRWQLGGSLSPASGGQVMFSVKVDN